MEHNGVEGGRNNTQGREQISFLSTHGSENGKKVVWLFGSQPYYAGIMLYSFLVEIKFAENKVNCFK